MTELFPFQAEAAKWLASRRHALLNFEMGLGKTAIAITAADLIPRSTILVLCPAIARENWKREFERFSKTKNSSIDIFSYSLCHHINEENTYDLLILDECHFLKSPLTRRTKAVLGKNGLSHRAKRVWALSGTPAPNNAAELWPILYTCGQTPLRYSEFVERYCNTYRDPKFGLRIIGTKKEHLEELRAILKQFSLRKTKEEALPFLPPISFEEIAIREKVPFTNLFDQFQREVDILKEALRVDPETLETIASSVPTLRRVLASQKVSPIVTLVQDELEGSLYSKIVIFALHREAIRALTSQLQRFGALSIFGETKPEDRQKAIDEFQNPKSLCKVLVANVHTAGTAITLTAANQVLFLEQSWVPGENLQAAMRCHRIGQTRPVFVRFAVISNSIDEKVSATLLRKTRELASLFSVPTLSVENNSRKLLSTNALSANYSSRALDIFS